MKKKKVLIAKIRKVKAPQFPAEIIATLMALKEDVGWRMIVKTINDNIAVIEGKLHGEIKWEEEDTLVSLQNQRNDRIEMRDLPDTLIEIQNQTDAPDMNFDPYE